MTRKDIECAYTVHVDSGRIASPGKFQGEYVFAVAFHERWLEGFADEAEDGRAGFHVSEADRAEYPELGDATRVEIGEDDCGFVYCRAWKHPGDEG